MSDRQGARGVEIRVSEGEENAPYMGTHFSNAPASEPFMVMVPDLTVLPGEVLVRAQVVDADGQSMGEAVSRRLGVVRDEITDWVFDLSEAATSTPPGGNMSPISPSQGVTTSFSAILRTLTWGASGQSFEVEIPLSPTPLDEALAPLERQLLGAPTSLFLLSIQIEVFEPDEDNPTMLTAAELDELFDSPLRLSARIASGSELRSLATVPVPDGSSFEASLDPPVDVVGWVERPPQAAIILSGTAADGPESVVEIRVRGALRGTN